MKIKITLVVEVDKKRWYDPQDPDQVKWFYDDVLKNLVLVNNDFGELGKIVGDIEHSVIEE